MGSVPEGDFTHHPKSETEGKQVPQERYGELFPVINLKALAESLIAFEQSYPREYPDTLTIPPQFEFSGISQPQSVHIIAGTKVASFIIAVGQPEAEASGPASEPDSRFQSRYLYVYSSNVFSVIFLSCPQPETKPGEEESNIALKSIELIAYTILNENGPVNTVKITYNADGYKITVDTNGVDTDPWYLLYAVANQIGQVNAFLFKASGRRV